MTKIKFKDFRRAGVCKDALAWFSENGFDWRDLFQDGISVDELRKKGDALHQISALEAAARLREGSDGVK